MRRNMTIVCTGGQVLMPANGISYNTPQVGIGVNVAIKRVLRVYANDSPGNDREDAGILCRRGSATARSRNEQQHQADPGSQRPGGTSDQ